MDIMIVDDEPLARQRLHHLATELGYTVTAEAGDSDTAFSHINTYKPTILLLDIEMPGDNGLSLAQRISQLPEPPAIIFTTAYDQYALGAFDTLATSYLLKPITKAQLATALNRAQQVTKAQQQALTHQPSQHNHIVAKGHRGIERLPLNDIRYFMADQKYVMVISTQGQILIDDTLKTLEDKVGHAFIRIHRNALVSIAHIQGLNRDNDGHYRILFTDIADKPVVSRRYTSKIKALLQS